MVIDAHTAGCWTTPTLSLSIRKWQHPQMLKHLSTVTAQTLSAFASSGTSTVLKNISALTLSKHCQHSHHQAPARCSKTFHHQELKNISALSLLKHCQHSHHQAPARCSKTFHHQELKNISALTLSKHCQHSHHQATARC